MNDQLTNWLDEKMKEFEPHFREFNKGMMRKVPLWMALCIVGLTALGFIVGGDVKSVLKLHFPLGCGLAVFIWLCFFIQSKAVSMKRVRAAYEKEAQRIGNNQADCDAFLQQAKTHSEKQIWFMNGASDKYPCCLTVGQDYWLFFRSLSCCIVRAADIKRIYGKEETTRVGYDVGDSHVRQNLGIGVSIVIEYKEGSASANEKRNDKLFLENGDQLQQAMELIRTYCPHLAS